MVLCERRVSPVEVDGDIVELTLEELIERCAPFMAESCHITRDEAVSFMGALLPTLKRW